jgi:hypothetical protein
VSGGGSCDPGVSTHGRDTALAAQSVLTALHASRHTSRPKWVVAPTPRRAASEEGFTKTIKTEEVSK